MHNFLTQRSWTFRGVIWSFNTSILLAWSCWSTFFCLTLLFLQIHFRVNIGLQELWLFFGTIAWFHFLSYPLQVICFHCMPLWVSFHLIKTYFPCFTLKHFLAEILFSVSKSCASFLNSKLSLLFGFIFLWRKTIFWNKSVIFGEYFLWCWISLRRIGERGEGWRVRECFRNVALRKTQHLICSNFNSI